MSSRRTHTFTLPKRMRIFNKYVTNRILRVFVSLSPGPFALIRHTGRRSATLYETVIWVWPLAEGFVIALTYGRDVDWYRNIRAAGGGTLVWHKRIYALGSPEPIDAQRALTAFPRGLRSLLRRTGSHEFVWLRSSGSEPVKTYVPRASG